MAAGLAYRVCVDRADALAYEAVLTLSVPRVENGRAFNISCTREDGQIWIKWANNHSLSHLVRAGYCAERAKTTLSLVSLEKASRGVFTTVSLCSHLMMHT